MKLLLSAALSVLCLSAFAGIRLNRMFSEHMVLQRDNPVTLSGYADPDEEITVKLAEFQPQTVKASADGTWNVTFPALTAGGPYTLSVSGKTDKILWNDILAGDVWFCTGQSNMEWRVCNSGNADQEISAAGHPRIRFFHNAKIRSSNHMKEVPHAWGWNVCTPETVRDFSALAYYFGRALQAELNVPVGLINSGWGGPPISMFMNLNRKQRDIKSDKAVEAAAASYRLHDEKKKECAALLNNEKRIAELAVEPVSAEKLLVPSGYHRKELLKFNGIYQIRRTVSLPADWAGKELVLKLGCNSCMDRTYFNGVKVGGKRDWNSPVPGKSWDMTRVYRIPGEIVNSGDNVISVFVGLRDPMSWWGAFSGDLSLSRKDNPAVVVPLNGEWMMNRVITVPKPTEGIAGNAYGPMIYPFTALPVKGILFYQGEANASSNKMADSYLKDQISLIRDYRKQWGKEVPFLFVQLAAHGKEGKSVFMRVREAQRRTLAEVPKTGMACTIDIGNRVNIHPENKQEAGRRLMLQALQIVYGRNDITAQGPFFEALELHGNSAAVRFRKSNSKLVLKGTELNGFEAASDDGIFHAVKAQIEGDTVRLTDTVPIREVRYLWKNFPEEINLYNEAGLPAVPFHSGKY